MAVFGSHYGSMGYDNNCRTLEIERAALMNQMQQMQQQNALSQQMYWQLSNLGMMGGNAYQNGSCASTCAGGAEDFAFTRGLPPAPSTKSPEKKSMFKEIATDIKAFILEHRGVIYFIAFALIVDHFFFKGAFKARLEQMAEKIVAKVEEKI